MSQKYFELVAELKNQYPNERLTVFMHLTGSEVFVLDCPSCRKSWMSEQPAVVHVFEGDSCMQCDKAFLVARAPRYSRR